MTLLCVPILVHDAETALRLANQARTAAADLVEYRLDEFFHGDDAEIPAVVRLISDSPLPCIATCRPTAEGGSYDGPDDARISLFERLGTAFGKDEHPPRYIDLELSTWQRSANIRQKVLLAIDHPEQVRDLQTSLILSTHDFRARPSDLTRRLLAMRETPAHVLKIAYLARSLRDNLELFDLLAARDRPTIALAMGEPGLMSRILAPKFGGFLTFASLGPTDVTAPGQPTIHDLLYLYRFRSLTPQTAVYGVAGHPVSHSLSPHLHNAGFEAVNYDGVYLPLPIAPGYEPFKATLLELIDYAPLTLRGLSITLPHKESLVRLALERGWELDEPSAAIGAANTLVIDRDDSGRPSRHRVLNTDIPAVVESLADVVGDLAGQRAAILGAGGVARAAAFGLIRAGAIVAIFNRDETRAIELVASLQRAGLSRLNAADLASFSAAGFDLIINATPVGMKGGPASGQSPVPANALDNAPTDVAAMDTVYAPLDTPFLRAARAAGLRTIDGLSMFVAQASLQFAAFTGRPAPAGLFARIAREAAGNG